MSSLQAAAENLAVRAGKFCGKPLLAQCGQGWLKLVDARDQSCHVHLSLGGFGRRGVVEVYGRLSHTGLRYEEVLKVLLDSET